MDHPKRKYTLSAKALAANRANLVKARAVPEFWRFRTTEKRTRACRQNLLQARQALEALGDRSPAYGTHFRRGLYCVSLGRSAARAGERREDYDQYLKLFDLAIRPESALEQKLTRALAGAVWRRLRVWNGQARWERQCLGYRLEQAARGEYPPDDEWGPRSPAYCRQTLADEVIDILSTDFDLMAAVEKTQGRVELVWRALEGCVNPAGPRLEFRTRQRGWGEERLAEASAAALGNPFCSARYVAQRLEAKERGGAEIDAGRGRAGEERDDGDDEPLHGARFGLSSPGRHAWYALKLQPCAGDENQAGDAPPPLSSFEEFAPQFEAAFGNRNSEDRKSTWPDDFQASNVELRKVAELAWSRLEVYGERAKEERERVSELLEQAIRARAAGVDRRQRIRDLATAMLGLLDGHDPALRRAFELERALFEAFSAYLARQDEIDAQQEESEEETPPDPAADERETVALEAEAAKQLKELEALHRTLEWLDSRPPEQREAMNRARHESRLPAKPQPRTPPAAKHPPPGKRRGRPKQE